MTVLLVTNKRDITTDFIVLELRRRGLNFFRLNTEDIASAAVYLGFNSVDDWWIEIDGVRVTGSAVVSAYFRRPSPPKVPRNVTDVGCSMYCEGEWSAFLKSVYLRLEGKWLNSPFSINRSEDKSHQLTIAIAVGFHVPPTIMTNHLPCTASLSDSCALVGKTMRTSLIEGITESVIFTSQIGAFKDDDAASLSMAPIIIQREISKISDIRVTVVGAQCFATEIRSQDYPDTKTDWRRGSIPDLEHKTHTLPPAVARMCIELVQHMDLRFGAIDLVLGDDETYWFLEINPNGQWAWIENRTGQLISSAIVDELIGGAV